jgi:hypothetical protein
MGKRGCGPKLCNENQVLRREDKSNKVTAKEQETQKATLQGLIEGAQVFGIC